MDVSLASTSNFSRGDVIRAVYDILLPKTKEEIVEELFAEHFQPFFEKRKGSEVQINPQAADSPNSSILEAPDDFWVFGYADLIWKPEFPYIQRRKGYIEGYERRFFQYSNVGRGTREKPGRVVTIVTAQKGRVYGVAYRIPSCEKEEAELLFHLRTKKGYESCTLLFTDFESEQQFKVIAYVAKEDNESFAASTDKDLEIIAEQIYLSAGRSGTRREYLFKLADAMRELFPRVGDDHLFRLERMVKLREKRDQELINAVKAEIKNLLDEGDVDEVIEKFNVLKSEVQQSMIQPWALNK